MAIYGRSYIKPHIGKFIGPYPLPPGPVAPNRIVLFHRPPISQPRPHITPILGPQPSAAPVSTSLLFKAKQPRVLAPRPHITLILGPQPSVPPVSANLLLRAKLPRLLTPRPRLQPFRGYVPAPPPVSRNLLVRVRYKLPPTRILANSVSVLNLPVPVVTVVFRRTLSQEGTRVGERQEVLHG